MTGTYSDLWTERYRPTEADRLFVPEAVRAQIRGILDSGQVPNMILHGSAGTGKTSAARLLVRGLGSDSIMINGSEQRGIEVLRTLVQDFASTQSLDPNNACKVLIIDEADNLTPDMQKGMRHLIEQFSGTCRFIFTANWLNRIIRPLHSRCQLLDFNSHDVHRDQVCAGIWNDIIRRILIEEGADYDEMGCLRIIYERYPDIRKMLISMQTQYESHGRVGVTGDRDRTDLDGLLDVINGTEPVPQRIQAAKKLLNGITHDHQEIYDWLYRICPQMGNHAEHPEIYITLAEYQYKSGFVANQHLNTLSCLVEIMLIMEG